MKFAFLAGGFLGFALVALAGFTAGRSADLVLRDAALACLVGALVLRWFWSVVIPWGLPVLHRFQPACAERP
jgi:hypothetical protein